MGRNRNGRNVQLGPGKQTAKTGVWFGEIERKLSRLLSLTVLPLNYFMVQHFASRESLHRRKGAASPIINKVFLYRSPIPGILLVHMTTCLCSAYRKGGGQHPVVVHIFE
jgi:hypothetical protein